MVITSSIPIEAKGSNYRRRLENNRKLNKIINKSDTENGNIDNTDLYSSSVESDLENISDDSDSEDIKKKDIGNKRIGNKYRIKLIKAEIQAYKFKTKELEYILKLAYNGKENRELFDNMVDDESKISDEAYRDNFKIETYKANGKYYNSVERPTNKYWFENNSKPMELKWTVFSQQWEELKSSEIEKLNLDMENYEKLNENEKNYTHMVVHNIDKPLSPFLFSNINMTYQKK